MKYLRVKKKSSLLDSSIYSDMSGLAFLFISMFTLLALLSYSAQDPSWFSTQRSSINNITGIVGSYWAALLIQCFGMGSFLFALLILLSGIACFREIDKKSWLLAVANYFFLLLFLSTLLSIISERFVFHQTSIYTGGLLGNTLKKFLLRTLNVGGISLLTLFTFIFAVSTSFKISIRTIFLACWNRLLLCGTWLLATCEQMGSTLFTSAFKLGIWFYSHTKKEFQNQRPQIEGTNTHSTERKQIEQNLIQVLQRKLYANFLNSEKLASPIDSYIQQNSSISIIARDPNAIIPTSNKSDTPTQKRGIEKFFQKLSGTKKDYELPPLSLLRTPIKNNLLYNRNELINNSQVLEEKIKDFRIQGSISAVKPGPVITIYEFKPGTGVKVNSIANLADDLALALSAQSVRIEAPIPGRDVVGIEVPNITKEEVFLKEIIDSKLFYDKKFSIPIAIGKDTMGDPVVHDLKKMPHMLVAGATGSGKSVFINSLICSLLYRFSPNELKLILVDPKQLELNFYDSIPHLLLPVVTEAKKASLALRWAVNEMERRYQMIARSGMRDVDGFNQKLEEIGESAMATKLGADYEGKTDFIPKIVIIIDELADLMMTAKSDVENNICRLAQKARAAGIHLVLATQRPSVDVITGLIKANLPARLSFRLSSKNDSRTIFDTMGAERLVGNGDMLFMPPGESRLLRMHGAYISESEIEKITDYWRSQGSPEYREEILIEDESNDSFDEITPDDQQDPLLTDAIDIAITTGFVSASMLQRRFRVGYNRAARMVEQMESQGLVGPADGSKPRAVLIQR